MTKRDLERIAFVTKHFQWMRNGFVLACLGPMFFIAVAAKDAPPWVQIVLMAASILIFVLAERWTTRRFGRVVPDERPYALRRFENPSASSSSFNCGSSTTSSLAPGFPSLALMFVGAVVLWSDP